MKNSHYFFNKKIYKMKLNYLSDSLSLHPHITISSLIDDPELTFIPKDSNDEVMEAEGNDIVEEKSSSDVSSSDDSSLSDLELYSK